ncbi:MAG TPA: glutathione S-transferase family protein [Caulobacteraceae bacterium]|nr:glutathione S-transferase family protein [Caulobacteraceae bacterium]
MLTFYHAPGTRSGAVRWLLEELGVDYRLEIVDIRAEGGAPEAYRSIQPSKKVPAIVHDGVAVHERAAIFAYLCDAFPDAGLAPPIGDARRGPYLSWLVYNDAVIDPVLAAKFGGWTYDKLGVSFGDFDDMALNLETTLSRSPYLTGETLTSADLLVGGAVNFAVRITKGIAETPALAGFIDRTVGRPSFARYIAADRALQAG